MMHFIPIIPLLYSHLANKYISKCLMLFLLNVVTLFP